LKKMHTSLLLALSLFVRVNPDQKHNILDSESYPMSFITLTVPFTESRIIKMKKRWNELKLNMKSMHI